MGIILLIIDFKNESALQSAQVISEINPSEPDQLERQPLLFVEEEHPSDYENKSFHTVHSVFSQVLLGSAEPMVLGTSRFMRMAPNPVVSTADIEDDDKSEISIDE